MKTATKNDVVDTIRKNSEKVMTHYLGDLDIDEAEIEKRPGIPFLHWTRPTGTLIVFLYALGDLPKKGETVSHLFSCIDRNAVVQNILSMSEYYTKPANDNCKLVQYFNGKTVRKIDVHKAFEIGRNHANRLWAGIEREKREKAEACA